MNGLESFLQLEKVLLCNDFVYFVAFKKYREHLIAPVQSMGCNIEVPMEGLRIGEQKRWLKKVLDKLDEQSLEQKSN